MPDPIPATDIALIAEAVAAGRVQRVETGASGLEHLQWKDGANGQRGALRCNSPEAASRWAHPRRHGKKPKPVTVRGVTYASYTAADRALGMAPGSVGKAAKQGKLDTVGLRGRKANG